MGLSGQPQPLRGYLAIALLLCIFAIAGISAGVAFAGANLGAVKQAAASAGGTNAPEVTATPTPCSPAWTVVSSPSPGLTNTVLFSLAEVSANDIWAVGFYMDIGTYETLVEHWDGTSWTTVPSPNPDLGTNYLRGVAAISANDVWAVGGTSGTQTLVEHWDGTSWSVIYSPSPGALNGLYGVAAISGTDVWAVGYSSDGTVRSTLAEHWDGTSWTAVPSPSPGTTNSSFSAVAVVSPSDIWAVGNCDSGGRVVTLVEHWDGISWTTVPSPNVGSSDNYLYGVAAISANDVWAAGVADDNSGVNQTLVEHWDGNLWTVVPSPSPGSAENMLYGIAVLSAYNVWAVGYYVDADYGARRTLVEHWDGTSWTTVPSPNQGARDNYLNGVAAVSANSLWAVGAYDGIDNSYQTLVEQYINLCLPSPTPVATSTATNTPPAATPTSIGSVTRTTTVTSTPTAGGTGTPTGTATPASDTATTTGTPTVASSATSTAIATASSVTTTSTPTTTATTAPISTPTTCPIQFSDVRPGSTFYPFVRCLACLGIINGYADGTFKPNNNVTRGQLSKIVSNAAGFSDPQTTQMYQDVPVGSTFQVYIGRLASRGYINGYACGGTGEPCLPPGNLPYFRPGNNATRGQISKIDANAAGFVDPPSGQQFEDVPAGSTYYAYTYRLVSRSVMGGYQCGGVGEPCIPPANLPYFRPNNNATRGQTSKIVANTFFPDCQIPER